MGSTKRKRLSFVVSAIQSRFGPKALQRGEQLFSRQPQVSCIPTGFTDLDTALDGIGGIPHGRLSEILSVQTAGAATLALKVIANAQNEGGLAAYMDLARTFDPDYAARCKVQLSRSKFLLVSPATVAEALEIAQELVVNRSCNVLIFDAISSLSVSPDEAKQVASLLRQLPQALANSDCALIFLTPLDSNTSRATPYPPGFKTLPHYAALRILLRKERWIIRRNDIRGYQSRAIVLNNKLGKAGRSAQVSITFNGVVEGDGT